MVLNLQVWRRAKTAIRCFIYPCLTALVLIAPHSTESTTASRISSHPSSNQFSKDNLRQLLVDMLQVRDQSILSIGFSLVLSSEWRRISHRIAQCLHQESTSPLLIRLVDRSIFQFTQRFSFLFHLFFCMLNRKKKDRRKVQSSGSCNPLLYILTKTLWRWPSVRNEFTAHCIWLFLF